MTDADPEDLPVCVQCKGNFNADDSTVTCNFCGSKYHVECAKIKEVTGELLCESRNLFWFCDDCVDAVQEKLNLQVKPELTEASQDVPKQLQETESEEVEESIVAKKRKPRPKLINFLLELLSDGSYSSCICWEDPKKRIFKIHNPTMLAHLWGVAKGSSSMNFQRLSRSLRNYYKSDMLMKRKQKGVRHCYQFTKKVPKKRILFDDKLEETMKRFIKKHKRSHNINYIW